jgi:hypothetical protein
MHSMKMTSVRERMKPKSAKFLIVFCVGEKGELEKNSTRGRSSQKFVDDSEIDLT